MHEKPLSHTPDDYSINFLFSLLCSPFSHFTWVTPNFFWARLDFRSAQRGGNPGCQISRFGRPMTFHSDISYHFMKCHNYLRHFMILSSYFFISWEKIGPKEDVSLRQWENTKGWNSMAKKMKFREVSSPMNFMKSLDEISGNLIWNFTMKFDREVSLQPWLGAADWFLNCWPAGPPTSPPSAVGVKKPVIWGRESWPLGAPNNWIL